MRAPTALGVTLMLFGGLAAGAWGCGSSPERAEVRPNGQACGAGGSSSCASNHCNNGFCCAAGNCCGVPADCPASYHSGPVCDDLGASTTCQGTRRDATCTDGTCATDTVADDSACDGAVRDCTPYAPVACTGAVDQAVAACLTGCTVPADCAPGYACDGGGQCVVKVGLGQACSGSGQGTCGDGLKCENAVCCDAASGTCCSDSSQCSGGLACDVAATHACFTTCTDGTSTRCASASTFCQSNACVDKLSQGVACTASGQCATGNCAQGVCCNSACDAACTSCNDPSNPSTRGQCLPVADDDRCGRISCQGLNGQCRIYNDVTTARCQAGACKPPNDTTTCTSYSDSNALCGFCQKCAGGSCVNQLASEDLKSECPAGACLTGNCNGAGACGFAASGSACNDGAACTSGDVCDAAGRCAGTAYTCPPSTACQTVSCNGAGGCTTSNRSGSCGRCGTCSGGVCTGDCGGSAICCFPGCATPPQMCP